MVIVQDKLMILLISVQDEYRYVWYIVLPSLRVRSSAGVHLVVPHGGFTTQYM